MISVVEPHATFSSCVTTTGKRAAQRPSYSVRTRRGGIAANIAKLPELMHKR